MFDRFCIHYQRRRVAGVL